jgi:hypothetical protein
MSGLDFPYSRGCHGNGVPQAQQSCNAVFGRELVDFNRAVKVSDAELKEPINAVSPFGWVWSW